MGTGCISTPKKFNQCSDEQKISSNCVLYQGEPVPLLGICTGDTMTEVETAILNSLSDSLEAINVNITDVNLTNCAEILNMLNGVDKNASTLFDAIIKYSCSLKLLVTNYINSQSFTINLNCITATNPLKLSSIVQGIIDFSCDLQEQITNLTTIVNDTSNTANIVGNLLKDSITSCGNSYGVSKTGIGEDVNINLYGFVLPFGLYPFYGPLTWFDNTGKGISTTPACNYYLCNGNNGTPDMRGFTAVGAINNISGSTLDPLVDPTINNDSSMNYSVNSKGGKAKVVLNNNNIPAHSHTINDPGHSHNFNVLTYQLRVQGGSGFVLSNTAQSYGQSTTTISTTPSPTNITINPTISTNESVENRMPFKAFAWVMFKPVGF